MPDVGIFVISLYKILVEPWSSTFFLGLFRRQVMLLVEFLDRTLSIAKYFRTMDPVAE